MIRRVYIETSVVSYYTGKVSRDVIIAGHQQSTHDFRSLLSGDLAPHVSALARKRLNAIDPFPVLATTAEAEQLAQSILNGRGIPEEYPEDALHIAIAAIAGMDFIATWNFSHINNPFTKMMIRQAVENAGYECPEIVSPEAFVGEEI